MVGGSYSCCHLLGKFSLLQPGDTASHSERPSLKVTLPEQRHIPADVMTGHLAQAVSVIARYGEMNCTFIL